MLSAPTIPVLMYHHVSPVQGAYTVAPELFRSQLLWMRDNGFNFLTGNQFEKIIRGDMVCPSKPVLLTFDDGWFDNWVYVYPILKELNVPALFFVITAWPGDGEPRMALQAAPGKYFAHSKLMKMVDEPTLRDQVVMRWSELKLCEAEGLVSLQSHSHSHGDWWQCQDEQSLIDNFCADLDSTVANFVKNIGRKPTQFCWPRGDISPYLESFLIERGFLVQFSTIRGGNKPSSEINLPVVLRLNVENRSIDWFKQRINWYSNRFIGTLLGAVHGMVHPMRMAKKYPYLEQRKFFPVWFSRKYDTHY